MDYMDIDEPETNKKTEFGIRIATLCILEEINNGCLENLVLSPLLFHISLNMVASASTGRTLQQFLHVLESESITDLNAQSSLFMELATTSGGGPIISFANGIWVHSSFPVKHSFKQLAENVYKAKAESVDFVNEEERVIREINLWAREATKGHIDPLLPQGFSITKDDIALLASAIYFKGTWTQKFDASYTEDENFYLLNGQMVRVPFMKGYCSTQSYGSFESFQLLKMEYKKGQFDLKKYAMYIFLPHRKDGVQELIRKFSCDTNFLLKNREVQRVELARLWVPKLKYDCILSADEMMKGAGLYSPFDEKEAEITEMVETPPNNRKFYLSETIQKAYIEVNEEGTVATAITGFLYATASAPSLVPPPPKPSFIADHPFMFMIKEEVSDIILFIGAAINPDSEGEIILKMK